MADEPTPTTVAGVSPTEAPEQPQETHEVRRGSYAAREDLKRSLPHGAGFNLGWTVLGPYDRGGPIHVIRGGFEYRDGDGERLGTLPLRILAHPNRTWEVSIPKSERKREPSGKPVRVKNKEVAKILAHDPEVVVYIEETIKEALAEWAKKPALADWDSHPAQTFVWPRPYPC